MVRAGVTPFAEFHGPGSSQGLDAALANSGRLSTSTAQRLVRFWQVRQDQQVERNCFVRGGLLPSSTSLFV